jgi:hypothetical protein
MIGFTNEKRRTMGSCGAIRALDAQICRGGQAINTASSKGYQGLIGGAL